MRGGEPLCAPGCCGKFFHQRCMDTLIHAGHTNCPSCRAAIAAPAAAPPAAAPSTFSTLGSSYPPAPRPRPASQSSRLGSAMFGNFFGSAPAARAGSRATGGSGIAAAGFEDPLVPLAAAVDPAATVAAAADLSSSISVVTNCLPEKKETHMRVHPQFFASLDLKYNNNAPSTAKNPIDLVCVLDVSGSMSGDKIENLKRAMEFVLSSLGPNDRLSLVSFQSRADRVHGLARMTDVNKFSATSLLRNLSAGGGTDIFAGLNLGWSVLKNRRERNHSSCIFLLTDGQDNSNLPGNIALAKEIKQAGASLLVFGFGADHDSALMTSIAEAAEGAFTYIETPDTVIDAFGGALGTQQGGQALKNVTLTVTATTPGVLMNNVASGIYTSTIAPGGLTVTTTFANLFSGEKRNILLDLALPAAGSWFSSEVETQHVLSVQARYDVMTDTGVRTLEAPPSTCIIGRVPDSKFDASAPRDKEVDAEINRYAVTQAIKEALQIADRGDLARALTGIENVLEMVRASISFKSGDASVMGLIEELNDAKAAMSNREHYTSGGGRAMMSEGCSKVGAQRSLYTKAGKASMFQSPMSCMMQSRATDSKSASRGSY